MSNKVDKFFKEKLEAHTLQPSAQAWEKVESHLSKKNKMIVWFRVAAAVALLGLLTFAALNWNSGPETKTEYAREQKPDNQSPPVTPETQTVAPEEKHVAKAPSVTPVKKKSTEEQEKKKHAISTEDDVKDKVIQPVEQQVAIVEETTAAPTTVEKKQEKSIVLVYSLPSVKKQEAPVVAEEVKKTGLERVLEIAKDVKNSDNALGDLREAKNDIFALDFKRDKDKSKKQ